MKNDVLSLKIWDNQGIRDYEQNQFMGSIIYFCKYKLVFKLSQNRDLKFVKLMISIKIIDKAVYILYIFELCNYIK